MPDAIISIPAAVPVFIGFTERAAEEGEGTSLHQVPLEIQSVGGYERSFGGRPLNRILDLDYDRTGTITGIQRRMSYFLHEAVRLFFANGGKQCRVISAGLYNARGSVSYRALSAALAALDELDGPALLAIPDAVTLRPDRVHRLHQEMLLKAAGRGDSFALLDVPQSLPVAAAADDFRRHLGEAAHDYGAAFLPFLRSSLTHTVCYAEVQNLPLVRRLVRQAGEEFAEAFEDAATRGVNPADESELRRSVPTYGAFMVRFDREPLTVPPSGAIAGLIVSADRSRTAARVLAQTAIEGVSELSEEINEDLQESMESAEVTGVSLNPLRTTSGLGITLGSARTLSGKWLEWEQRDDAGTP